MDRIRRLIQRQPRPSYEPLEGGSIGPDGEPVHETQETEFSWLQYSVFLLLGISMLWAWNMFLAAAPYFQKRFQTDQWILTHFQSAIISVSTVTNLGSMLVLTKLQARASYPKRITLSLIINIASFTLLALSTTIFRNVSAGTYLGYLLTMVFAASLATGFSQNGVFSYVSGFQRREYTQGIMTGQAVAGVLPCIAQIVSVLSVPAKNASDPSEQDSSTSAFAYFLTATAVSAITLVAFAWLVRRHTSSNVGKRPTRGMDEAEEQEQQERKMVSMWTLFKKLHWLACALFLCFCITMVFPVFTAEIMSVRSSGTPHRLFQPASFVPFAFLIWNAGDLIGRLLTSLPSLSLTSRPLMLFLISLARIVFIPLYLLCNIRGEGAVITSDAFYLIIVQFLFGTSNGYLGSSCMMGVGEWVEREEREAAGGFMGLCLVAGLTVGSLLSFAVANA
ncbi:MAG: hypothetical protein M1835_005423 [Candelina submexicana]|nr:MAG: hypothetical protein M1835_005423 [Candelina submexicana]